MYLWCILLLFNHTLCDLLKHWPHTRAHGVRSQTKRSSTTPENFGRHFFPTRWPICKWENSCAWVILYMAMHRNAQICVRSTNTHTHTYLSTFIYTTFIEILHLFRISAFCSPTNANMEYGEFPKLGRTASSWTAKMTSSQMCVSCRSTFLNQSTRYSWRNRETEGFCCGFKMWSVAQMTA